MSDKPLASVSLDLDNLWSYLKIHGDDGWQSRPSYLDVFVPHALETLDQLGIKITFFIVGLDAAEDRNGKALRAIADAGHEIGNHSFEHEPWLHLYTPEQVRSELQQADAAIQAATGCKPIGFRGPGFSWSEDVLETLVELGHRFDASTLPTYLGPLARAYYFWTAKMTAEERAKREGLFGKFSDGLRPVKPYRWQLKSGRHILEIPVTTMPLFKTPFHFSYLAYLSNFSTALMHFYFGMALAACRLTRTEPSFLLHPLDIIGGDQIPQLKFFPGMDISSQRKTELFKTVLGKLGERYDIVPMGVHARAIEARGNLALRAVS
ncbi:MAG TPA: polysaccharide deacetylase family protein [Steroidobacteraceae bacterium]|nr:polysaccharide deacetylase family protein [Steroidobacteraceae bacterium]